MERRVVLLMDVDGVVADFVGGTFRLLRRMGGPDLTGIDHGWQILDSIHPMFHRQVIDGWCRQGFCLELPEYPGAADAVRRLAEVVDLVFVTSVEFKSLYWVYERASWLAERFDEFGLLVCGGMGEGNAKRRVKRKALVDGDVLVDDKVENVVEWAEAHPEGWAFLWARSYNDVDGLPCNVIRTNDWKRVEHTIVSLVSAINLEDEEVA